MVSPQWKCSDIINDPKEGRPEVTDPLGIVAHKILMIKTLLVEDFAIHCYAGPSNISFLWGKKEKKKKKKEHFGLGEQSCLNFDNASGFGLITMWESTRGITHFLWWECHGTKSNQRRKEENKNRANIFSVLLWHWMAWADWEITHKTGQEWWGKCKKLCVQLIKFDIFMATKQFSRGIFLEKDL